MALVDTKNAPSLITNSQFSPQHTYKVGPPNEIEVGEHNSDVTMVYGTYNELVIGAFVNQLTSLGGPTL